MLAPAAVSTAQAKCVVQLPVLRNRCVRSLHHHIQNVAHHSPANFRDMSISAATYICTHCGDAKHRGAPMKGGAPSKLTLALVGWQSCKQGGQHSFWFMSVNDSSMFALKCADMQTVQG